MVIDDDLFPLVASINTIAMELRAFLHLKDSHIFSLRSKIRKLCVPKQ